MRDFFSASVLPWIEYRICSDSDAMNSNYLARAPLPPRMQTPHPSRTASAPPSSTRGEGKDQSSWGYCALQTVPSKLIGLPATGCPFIDHRFNKPRRIGAELAH